MKTVTDADIKKTHSMILSEEKLKAKKEFELIVVPGMGHSGGGRYGERKRRDFFVRHLLGEETPDWNIEPEEDEEQQDSEENED